MQLALGALAVFTLVVVGTSFAASRLAEREAVNDAAHTTDLLAEAVVQPALDDALLTGDAAASTRSTASCATACCPTASSGSSSGSPTARSSTPTSRGWSGQRFALGEEERDVLAAPADPRRGLRPDRPENEFERGQGKLLEVYRPVWTPTGRQLLFETYSPYDAGDQRTGQLWRGLRRRHASAACCCCSS